MNYANNYRKNDRQDDYDRHYRKIEAMYRKGYSINEMCMESELTERETIDIIQRIFGRDMVRAEREYYKRKGSE